MKRIALFSVGVLAMVAGAFAQTPDIDTPVLALPQNLRADAGVVKWKPDHTYDVIRKGTNLLACYDRSDERDRTPFAAQCTNLANLPREAQNRKLRAETKNTAEENAAIAAAEKAGTRVKPEFGSLWFRMDGKDKDSANLHVTIAVPGATTASIGLPDNGRQGGAWLMDAGTSAAHLMVPGR